MRYLLLIVIALLTRVGDAQWAETRKAFIGTPDERTISVPFYHPYVGGDDTSDFTWAFFYDYRMIPEVYRSPEYQRLCMRQMANIGLNSFTAVGWGGKDLSDVELQLGIAIEEGLAKRPVLVLPTTDPISVANNLTPPPGCPEIIGYGPDEPAASQEAADKVAKEAAQWRSVGMRSICSMGASEAEVVGAPLDIWMIKCHQLGDLKKPIKSCGSTIANSEAPTPRSIVTSQESTHTPPTAG